MKSNKKAGVERPFTLNEFWRLINDEAIKQNVAYINEIEYFDGHSINADKTIETPCFDVISRVQYGGSEGIYASFYFSNGTDEDVKFAVAKTLLEKDKDYISMHTFAGHICLIAMNYIKNHMDEFNWVGYDVNFIKDGQKYGGWHCHSKESAYEKAKEAKMKDAGLKVYIRCNSTRKTIEYNLP